MNSMLINRTSGEPVFRQVSQLLRIEIKSRYSAGDMLDSEQVLADRYGINRHTLRRAVESLIDEGILRRVHGKGTLVLDLALNYSIGPVTRFTQNVLGAGRQTEVKVLQKKTLVANQAAAEALEINQGAPLFYVETLRFLDGQPICLISHFFPLERLDGMKKYHSGSIHQFLKENFGIDVQRSQSLITAKMPQNDDNLLLQWPKNQPILQVKSVNRDTESKKPVEYAVTRFRADRIQLSVEP